MKSQLSIDLWDHSVQIPVTSGCIYGFLLVFIQTVRYFYGLIFLQSMYQNVFYCCPMDVLYTSGPFVNDSRCLFLTLTVGFIIKRDNEPLELRTVPINSTVGTVWSYAKLCNFNIDNRSYSTIYYITCQIVEHFRCHSAISSQITTHNPRNLTFQSTSFVTLGSSD